MKISFAQINSKIGDVTHNAKKVSEAIQEAVRVKAELLVCPELVLTGYPPRDLLQYDSLVDDNLKALELLSKETKGIVALVGFVERNPKPTGKPFYNSVAILRDGNISAVARKQLLPYYDVFDDERYFEPGGETVVFRVGKEKVAVLVCEDIWNERGFVIRAYPQEPLQSLSTLKPSIIVNISASPFHVGKPEERLKLLRTVAKSSGAAVAFCNGVGANDDIIFDGGSFLLSSSGNLQGIAPAFQEGTFTLDSKKPSLLSLWPDTSAEWRFEALVLGLKDYFWKSGQSKAVIGLSGGIDSSVTAVIAVKALGAKNVLGICLPSRFTAHESNEDAQILAARLGIQIRVLPLESTHIALERTVTEAFGGALKELTKENLQPRIRMALLMAVTSEWGGLLLNTSNKSELSAGFATLYGDSAGAIGVLGDLLKREVYEMGEFINSGGELIPSRVFTRAPTAELKVNQTDQDVLPPYDELDRLVEEFVVGCQPVSSIVGVSDQSKRVFSRLYAATEYKRRQFAPILRVSARAFGSGRRVPTVAKIPGLMH